MPQNDTTITQTAEKVDELAGCMWQLLNDMGKDGLSVCAFAKAQARIAMEPFINDLIEAECLMPLAEAERIVRECKSE